MMVLDITSALGAVSWLDVVLMALLAVFVFTGYRKGFVRQVVLITGLVVALVLAAQLSGLLARQPWLDGLRETHADLPLVVAYLALFLAGFALTHLAFRVICLLFPERRLLKPANSALGAALGGVKAVLLLGGLCIGLMQWRDLEETTAFSRSALAPRLADGCRRLVLLIPEENRDRLIQFGRVARERAEKGLSTLHLDPGDPENATAPGSSDPDSPDEESSGSE